MKTKPCRSTFNSHSAKGLLAVLFVALLGFGELAVFAQEPQATPAPAPSEQDAPKIPNDQLDALVSPIALYPDPLLSQVLVASTYPLELVQLQQWLEKSGGYLNEKAVSEKVKEQSWDPSIQAMAVLPSVVKRLVVDIKWTTDLGNAFLAQQSDVMDAVQRMRTQATEAGKLKSDDKMKVETRQVESRSVVVIEQASPEVVYVPSYDPAWIWGSMYAWPGIYYPPYGYYGGAFIGYGAGIAIGVAWGGGWGYGCGWGNGNININRNNNFVSHYNNTNINRGGDGLGSGNNNWQHNPQHRGGAPYSNRATGDRFGSGRQNSGQLGGGGRAQAGNLDLSGLSGDRGASNLGGNRGNVGGGSGSIGGDRGAFGGGGMGGDRIGSRDLSRSPSTWNNGSFGGSGSFGRDSARASSSRGSSSMGGYGGRGGGGFGGGGRGGGGRGGGGRRR